MAIHTFETISLTPVCVSYCPLVLPKLYGSCFLLPSLVNAPADGGSTELMKEAREVENVKLLLEAGAYVNAADESLDFLDRRTALMWAAGNGHAEVVKLLLEAGADINVYGMYGRTALTLAEGNGHAEIVKLLLEAGTVAYMFKKIIRWFKSLID